MFYKTKKALYCSAFSVVLGFSLQLTCAMEGRGSQTVVLDGLPHTSSVSRTLTMREQSDSTSSPLKTQPMSWGQLLGAVAKLPWEFTTSLFEPFVSDAPKALEAVKKEGKKIEKQGIVLYAWNVSGSVAKTVIENPLDTIMLSTGLIWGGSDLTECSPLVPLTMGVVGGIKNGKTLYALASSMDAETVVSKSLQLALYGGAIYAVASLPVAYALSTVSLGTEGTLNQASISSSAPSSAAGLADGNVVVVWPDNSNNIAGRIFYPNGTAITSQFNVSTSAPSSRMIPSVAGLTGGNFFVTWQGNTTTILSRILSSTGTAVTSPFQTNQVTSYADIAGPEVTSLTGGNALVSWGGSSPSNYNIPARIFYPNGTAVTNEFNIVGGSTTLLGGLSITGTPSGSALAIWGNSTGLYGTAVSLTGTVGSPFLVNQTAIDINTLTTSVTALTGGNVIAAYAQGPGGTLDSILGRVIQNGAAVGNEFNVTNVFSSLNLPVVTALTSGDAIALWQQVNTTTLSTDVYGTLISSGGVVQTSQFSIPTDAIGIDPSVTSLTNGGAFASWYDIDLGSLRGRSISLSTGASPSPTPSVSPSPSTGSSPSATPSVSPSPSTGSSPSPSASPSPGYSSASTLTPGLFGFSGEVISGALGRIWDID